MKALIAIAVAVLATGANAQTPDRRFPSCDLKAQHALKGEIGGTIKDPRQAHIAMRADILQADLGNARKARRLTQATANRLYRRVEAVKTDAARYTRKQTFLSAAETASYDRTLDGVAAQICHRR